MPMPVAAYTYHGASGPFKDQRVEWLRCLYVSDAT